MPHKKGHKTKTASQKSQGKKGGRSSVTQEDQYGETQSNGHRSQIGEVEKSSWYE